MQMPPAFLFLGALTAYGHHINKSHRLLSPNQGMMLNISLNRSLI